MAENRPWLTRDLLKEKSPGTVSGECAACHKVVHELLCLLDDAYNVWKGVCPYCGAWNFLSMNHGLRGYSSGGMHLVLPTPEEAEANGLPDGVPLADSKGPVNAKGSPLAQFCEKLTDQ